jgi:hypothetical protein
METVLLYSFHQVLPNSLFFKKPISQRSSFNQVRIFSSVNHSSSTRTLKMAQAAQNPGNKIHPFTHIYIYICMYMCLYVCPSCVCVMLLLLFFFCSFDYDQVCVFEKQTVKLDSTGCEWKRNEIDETPRDRLLLMLMVFVLHTSFYELNLMWVC